MHSAWADGGAPRQKVPHPLGRGPVVPTPQSVGCRLQLPLEGDTRQGIFRPAIVLWRHVHQQAAIDILLVPGEFAHAVGDHPLRLRSGRHHLPAGADAEGVGRPAAGQMAGELVGRRRKPGMPGVLPVLGGVAVRLPVFDPHPHGEGLGLHGHTPFMEHGEGVPGGVPWAEEQVGAGKGINALRPLRGDAPQGAVPDVQIRQPALKPDVRSQFQQTAAQIYQNGVEIIRAHMGFGIDQNILRSAAG